jgi:hypothetical protein
MSTRHIMRINTNNGRLLIMSSILFFSLLLFLGILGSCSLKTTIISPEGTWSYPGGAAEPMSMVFHSGGKLTFVGGFKKFHPATWQYDKKTQILQIKVSNYDKSNIECGDDYGDEYSCLLYNQKTDSFECKWTEKTKSLSFLGWNFLRK